MPCRSVVNWSGRPSLQEAAATVACAAARSAVPVSRKIAWRWVLGQRRDDPLGDRVGQVADAVVTGRRRVRGQTGDGQARQSAFSADRDVVGDHPGRFGVPAA